MFGLSLQHTAAVYASVTGFSAFWVCVALPMRHERVGPYNYHRAIKAGRRIPWRRMGARV
ncbi:hypothetical protein LTR95_004787 [Oleoguttula sp. CCFEE 5521]